MFSKSNTVNQTVRHTVVLNGITTTDIFNATVVRISADKYQATDGKKTVVATNQAQAIAKLKQVRPVQIGNVQFNAFTRIR